jgi:hypothetical protein
MADSTTLIDLFNAVNYAQRNWPWDLWTMQPLNPDRQRTLADAVEWLREAAVFREEQDRDSGFIED